MSLIARIERRGKASRRGMTKKLPSGEERKLPFGVASSAKVLQYRMLTELRSRDARLNNPI